MPELDIDDFRVMARRPQHYSNYELAGVLHQALDYLEQAKAELVGAKIFWTDAHERAEQAERERDTARRWAATWKRKAKVTYRFACALSDRRNTARQTIRDLINRTAVLERERDELRAAAATEKRLQAQLIGVMGEQFKGYAAEADRNIADLRAALRQAEAERDALKADREAST